MNTLTFQFESVETLRFAATPTLLLKLRVTNTDPQRQIQNIQLECQLQLEVARRRYSPEEQGKLSDLFGSRDRWAETLRTMHWTHARVTVPPFEGQATVDLHVPCTFDFNVAATKYFHALEEGEAPLRGLFSGTVYYRGEGGSLQVARVSWDREATFRLPVSVWREMMDHYYPQTAWLCLKRDVFEQLLQFKTERGIPTWEQALEELLSVATPAEGAP